MRRRSYLLASFSLLLVAGLSGCAPGSSPAGVATPAPLISGATATGMVHGGQQPVTGSTIQLYAVGTTGYGSGATPLIGATVTTSDGSGLMNSNANAGNVFNTLPAGFFTITGDYTCPSASALVYLLASGGNPGLTAGTNNSAIVMMTPLGQCGALTAATFVTVNEVTTVASAYALAEFSSYSGIVGSPSGVTAGIANAFANVNNLVNINTGTALATDSGGNAVPQATINTFANTVVPCVNSSGPSSPACATLFTDVFSGITPETVLAVMFDLALFPNVNATTLFGLSTANAPFQPTLSSAPYNWTLTLGGAASVCGYSGAGYKVSGTVNYSGIKTGQIYLALSNNSCSGGGTVGTSISSKGGYSIRGVPPGTYTLSVFMDTLGNGTQNIADPSASATVTLSGNTNLNSQNVTLVDPSTPTLSSSPGLGPMLGFNSGVFAAYNPIKSNGEEAATSYTLQWSTSATFATIAGSKTFAANGTHTDIWVLNGLTDGSIYYFRAYGSSAGTAVSSYSTVYGPVTIGAPSSGSTVSGTVTFSGTPTGPMYVGLYNQYTNTAYAEYIANPASPQAYSVVVPNSATAVYQPFAIIDQNNDGLIDIGDIQNTNGNSGASVFVTGTVANENMTLSGSNSTAAAVTQTTLSGGVQSYSFSVALQSQIKLPVSVTLQSSSNSDGANVTGPMDIAFCQNNSGCGKGFQIGFNLASSPTVGDTYFFNVTYSDATTETVSAAVTGVLTNFATNLAPTTGTSTSTTPTFSWTAPVCTLCSTYLYQFEIGPANGEQVWQVPGNANGLPYTTTTLTWPVDPTDSSNTPSVSNLTVGTNYTWTLTVQDPYGNSANNQVNYTP